MSERLDEGDLDAALARVRLHSDPGYDPVAMCACGSRIDVPKRWNVNLLDLVNAVAEHQPTCEAVKTDLQKAAAESIKRSGFKTKADFARSLGGDAMVMNDPIVLEIFRQLPTPFGPPSDFGWRTCHGCGGSSDEYGTQTHVQDCPGVCVRENCDWDHLR